MPTPESGASAFTWISRSLAALARAAIAIAAVALVCMALVEAWQVFARYVLNNSPSWTEPVALVLMSTTMMLGAAAGVRSDSHFGFFIGVQSAPPALRRVLLVIARVVATVIGLLLAVWGGELLIDNWTIAMAGAPLPQGIVFLPISLGGVLIALFSLERLLLPTGATTTGHSASQAA